MNQAFHDDDPPGLKRSIGVLSAGAFASAIANRISDPLIPQLSHDFSVSYGSASHAVSAFALAYGLMQLCYGPLGDRYGKFRVITWATLAGTFGALGSAIATSFDTLIAARLFTGATAAAIIPLSMAWIADRVPFQRRQPVLAYFLTGQIVGIICGQMLGGLLADYSGWRGAFRVLTSAFLVAAILMLSLRGSAVVADTPKSGDEAGSGFVAGIRRVLQRPWARVILATVLIEGAFLFGALAFVPSYLHQRFGISLTLAGSTIAFFGIGGLSYTLFARRLVASLGERGLARVGGTLMGGAMLLIAVGSSWLWVFPAAWMSGIGYYAMHNTLQTNATQMASFARGTAVSLFASCFFLGQSLGVSAASLAIDGLGYHAVFLLSAMVLPVLGWWFSHALRRRIQDD